VKHRTARGEKATGEEKKISKVIARERKTKPESGGEPNKRLRLRKCGQKKSSQTGGRKVKEDSSKKEGGGGWGIR